MHHIGLRSRWLRGFFCLLSPQHWHRRTVVVYQRKTYRGANQTTPSECRAEPQSRIRGDVVARHHMRAVRRRTGRRVLRAGMPQRRRARHSIRGQDQSTGYIQFASNWCCTMKVDIGNSKGQYMYRLELQRLAQPCRCVSIRATSGITGTLRMPFSVLLFSTRRTLAFYPSPASAGFAALRAAGRSAEKFAE